MRIDLHHDAKRKRKKSFNTKRDRKFIITHLIN